MNFLTTCLPNVEVLITVKMEEQHKDTKGKITIILKGKGLANGCLRIPLQQHMSPLRKGKSYSATCFLPHGLKCLESVGIVWRRKSLGNLFGAKRLTIHSITVIPIHDKSGGRQYIPSSKFVKDGSLVAFSQVDFDVENVP